MFEKINGPTNQYEGPATGLTTEKGDSWHTAVKKINDGFANIVKFLEGGAPAIESAAESGWEKVAHDLAEAMSLLQIKQDELEARVKAMSTAGTPPAPVLTTSTADNKAPPAATFGTAGTLGAALTGGQTLKTDDLDPNGKPATGGAPEPTTETLPGIAKLAEAEEKIPEPEVGKVTTTGPVDATSNG